METGEGADDLGRPEVEGDVKGGHGEKQRDQPTPVVKSQRQASGRKHVQAHRGRAGEEENTKSVATRRVEQRLDGDDQDQEEEKRPGGRAAR